MKGLVSEQIINRLGKPLKWAAFFMAYPVFTIIQNISFFFLAVFYHRIQPLHMQPFKVKSFMGFAALGLIFGAAVSTISAGIYLGFDFFAKAVNVLPNYTYWGVLIIFIGNTIFKFLSFEQIGKFIFFGVVANVLGRYALDPFLRLFPFYSAGSQNAFAFQIIIFSPIATSFIHNKYKNVLFTGIFIVVISLAGALSGSRSASILVLLGALSSILLGSVVRIAILAFVSLLATFIFPIIVESPAIKQSVQEINPRTYELLYETDNTLKTDRSYLTRLAMIEKGLNIFEDYPFTGIGIGNFMFTSYEIDFKFEGAEFIEYQEEYLKHTNAHNSYISFLSEGGLLLFIPMLLLMFYPILFFITNFLSIPNKHKGLFISVIFMCIHSWFITGMVNVMGWFILGIANAYIINSKSFLLKKQLV